MFKYKIYIHSKKMFDSPQVTYLSRYHIHFTWNKPDKLVEKFTIKMKNIQTNKTYTLVENEKLKDMFEKTFTNPLPTGTYHVTFKTASNEEDMQFVLPAMGKIATGGSCFLVDGKDFGYKKWCIMTNHHVIGHTKNKELIVTFDKIHFRLRYRYFKTHTNANQGLDYTLVGLTDEQMDELKEADIYPNPIDFDSEFKGNACILIHTPHFVHCRLLYTPCKVVKRTPTRVKYEYLGDTTSAGGSSGSPVFAMNNKHEIAVQGLHKANGVCIKMKVIKEDMMTNNKNKKK